MNDIEMLQTLTGEKDTGLLAILLVEAEERLLAATRRTDLISALKTAARSWALVAYNRLGMEGEVSRSEAGISSSFAEIPADIAETIRTYRLARTGGRAGGDADADEA